MLNIKNFGIQDYIFILNKMKFFTSHRNIKTPDELWLLEHYPIYTKGQSEISENISEGINSIPIVQSDRGGKITYHGPGQLIGYILMDLKRKNISIKFMIKKLEKSIIDVLSKYNIIGNLNNINPGVYIGNKKIASIGFRVKNHCTYHGFSLNVSMNMEPFKNINPCGILNLEMTQISNYVPSIHIDKVKKNFIQSFRKNFEY